MGRRLKLKLPTVSGLATAPEERIQLDASLVEGFVRTFLWKRFDSPKETPRFHRELWNLCCLSSPQVVMVAPRGHAKTTAVTLAFVLASILFGHRDFVLIVGSTEKNAKDSLDDIKVELTENEALIEAFHIHGLSTDNATELVGHVGERVFKIVVKGSEQKLRGTKWRKRRPNLVVVDDLEDDEQVMNKDRRDKLSDWFLNALLPVGSDECVFRVLGTILHEDSLLNKLLSDKSWISKRYSAHKDFDDFSQILWPEKFPESRLRAIRQTYLSQNRASGYSREYLNIPIAELDAYFQRDCFLPMVRGGPKDDYSSPKTYYVGVDLAISKEDSAANTAIVVAGLDPSGILHIVDVLKGHWDSLESAEKLFEVELKYDPDLFLIEQEQIARTLLPFLRTEMIQRGIFLPLQLERPAKDKIARAASFRARHKMQAVRYDKEAEWWDSYFHEMLSFSSRGSYSTRRDQVDATAWIGFALDQMIPTATAEEQLEAEVEYEEMMSRVMDDGRSRVTGY